MTPLTLTDAEILERFEACTLDDFHHADHVRVAWTLLRRLPLLDALRRFSDSLRRFAAAGGRPELYHETITWAYVLLIHQRMDGGDWESFARANSDLLTWRPSILDRYYSPQTLASPLARRMFVMPDRASSE